MSRSLSLMILLFGVVLTISCSQSTTVSTNLDNPPLDIREVAEIIEDGVNEGAVVLEESVEEALATSGQPDEKASEESTQPEIEQAPPESLQAVQNYRSIEDVLILPIERALPESSIQSEFIWFDGGASGGHGSACQRVLPGSSGLPQLLVQDLWNSGELNEGDRVMICAWIPPTITELEWELTPPLGERLFGQLINNSTGTIEIVPTEYTGGSTLYSYSEALSLSSGTYQIRLSAQDQTIIEASFEVPAATEPTVWLSGSPSPGNIFSVHYAGFGPSEIVTSTLYLTPHLYPPLSVSYGTWSVVTDGQGRANQRVRVEKAIPCDALISAVSEDAELNNRGIWDPTYGFVADIVAADIFEFSPGGTEEDCRVLTEALEPQFDRSLGRYVLAGGIEELPSRYLKQVKMGEIAIGETVFGILETTGEAHYWTIEPTADLELAVTVDVSQEAFGPRIGILDPDGMLVVEDAGHVLDGCYDPCELQFKAEKPGKYSIILDSSRPLTYSISVNRDARIIESDLPGTLVIVDDLDAEVTFDGPPDSWRHAQSGYAGGHHWTYAWDNKVSNSTIWQPNLPYPDYYEVLVYIPGESGETKHAKYLVVHDGEVSEVWVDQSIYENEWVSIGDYFFSADGSEYVYLDDVTGEPLDSQMRIAFDAVQFLGQD